MCERDANVPSLRAAIDYISDLLAERAALTHRLSIARNMVALGHPAAAVDPRHLDPHGVPLWEREWSGGMELDADGAAGAGEDGGSEDES